MLKVSCLYHKKIMGILFYVIRKLGVKSSEANAELALALVFSIACVVIITCVPSS